MTKEDKARMAAAELVIALVNMFSAEWATKQVNIRCISYRNGSTMFLCDCSSFL